MSAAYRLSTGLHGGSHVRRGPVGETAAHASFDWRNAPTPQHVIATSGALEFRTLCGAAFTLHPVGVPPAKDRAGTAYDRRFRAGAAPHFVDASDPT